VRAMGVLTHHTGPISPMFSLLVAPTGIDPVTFRFSE
jgi:hypothetical protein